MKDVLLVTPYYDPNIVGGAEISTQLIAEGLPARCDVLSFGPSDCQRRLNGVDIYEMSFSGFCGLWARPLGGTKLSVGDKMLGHFGDLWPKPSIVRRYLDFFSAHQYKTIIMNSNERVMDRPSLWKAAHESGAHVVLTLRDNLLLERSIGGLDYSGLYRRLIRKQLCWVDELVAPSQYMIDLYAEYQMAKKVSRVIPNAVKDPDVKAVPFSQKKDVLYAGSLSEQKGLLTLIEAVDGFVADENLTLIGRGPLSEAICGGGRVFKFDWMPKDELYRAMAKAKVLVLPSEWPEAFGRVLVEAVRCGTLVVGSNAGGIPEVLSFDDRYLFQSGDSAALVDRVNRILCLSEGEYVQELDKLQKKMKMFDLGHYLAAWSSVVEGTVV
ncbi:glycosyltransferase [Paratractidigestivibacter sp.]|uniref:glycosyltransferase n=1 Tax=Paratractidigestivibacter sp. TaxID=2847316 RepID=UPI002AC9043B|nr:glycosyltransferase [Paratractidigestivibacter sp.]